MKPDPTTHEDLQKKVQALEQALKDQETLSQTVIEGANDAIFVKDLQGRHLLVNSAAAEILGLKKQDMIGKTVEDLVDSELARKITADDRRVIEGQEALSIDEDFILEGDSRVFSTAKYPLFDGQGQACGLIGIARDITRRKTAEEALRRSEDNLAALINASAESAFLIDLQGRILAVNTTGARRLGFEPSELMGKPLDDYTPPEALAQRQAMIQKAASSGQSLSFTDQRGAYRFETTVWPIHNAQGQVDRLAVFAVDMARQHHLAEELQLKEAAVESAMNAVAIGDKDFKLIYVNTAFVKMWGLSSKDEAVGRLAFDFWEDREASRDVAATITRVEGWFGELMGKGKNGDSFAVQISAWPVFDKEGKIVAYMGCFVDITADKEAEQALQEQNRRLEEMNTALKVLMEHRETNRQQLAENVMTGVNTLVLPYVQRIRDFGLKPAQQDLIEVLETHLKELTDPLPNRLSKRFSGFTSREIEVAAMIRDGKSSEEIAQALCLSRSAVVFHRQNLRKKLGLVGQKKGLCSCLREIMSASRPAVDPSF